MIVALSLVIFTALGSVGSDDGLVVTGPNSWLISESPITVTHCRVKRYGVIAIRPEMGGDWRVEEEFINAIRGLEEITHTSFQDGVRYMEFTEAVTRSAQSGKKINLPF